MDLDSSIKDYNIYEVCLKHGYKNLAFLLGVLPPSLTQSSSYPPSPPLPQPKKFKILCNWMSPADIKKSWDKMSEDGHGRWKTIQLVNGDEKTDFDKTDFDIVINKTSVPLREDGKTIFIPMEPHWPVPPKEEEGKKYIKILNHMTDYNNIEWHLSKTYQQLNNGLANIEKYERYNKCVSAVLSEKYNDPGHIKRIDFVKYIERVNGPEFHVYGNNKWDYKNYKGSLPYHSKDEGLFPYKYTFNVENHDIPNYFTEKLIDGILSECLVFYSGCFNIREHIDPRAYVHLDLIDFEKDMKTIERAINEDWWSQRIDIIRAEKKRILDQLQFFPRIERIIKGCNL